MTVTSFAQLKAYWWNSHSKGSQVRIQLRYLGPINPIHGQLREKLKEFKTLVRFCNG